MSSPFVNYGSNQEVLTYLLEKFTDNNKFQTMINHLTPEWRNAMVYVFGRPKSKMQLYFDSMYKAYEAGKINQINVEDIKYGSLHFVTVVNQLCD